MPLTIDITQGESGTYRVKLNGSLDSDTYPEFDTALEPAMADPDARALRLEMQDLRFISSMGLGSIVKARRAIEAKGGVLVIIEPQPQVRKVFDIVRMLPEETVFASREEADEYFALIQRKVVEERGDAGTPIT
jgi:anti-anti-sigma factor